MAYAVEKLKARRNAAQRERDQFQPLLDEAYQYAIPFRKGIKHTGAGEKRVNQAFDHTAIEAAFRFAGKLQQDLWPEGQQNFELEPGPLVQDPAQRDELGRELAKIAKVVQAFFEDGSWDMAFHEAAIDLSAGTGAIYMPSTADPQRLWDPMSVSIEEIMIECGANGRVTGIFWDRKGPLRTLFEAYPDGNFGKDLTDLYKAKPETEVDYRLDTVFDPKTNRWRLCVWCTKQDALIEDSQTRTCPWLIPRYYRVPGESYGRGVVMLAMPAIKTTNTAVRLQLQAAAIAMLGIYTAVDDGVFNPDLSPIEPGAFWKVARNGGTLGKSIERLPEPRLDLTQIVLKDLRAGIKGTMMDNDLPMAGEAVKTPTEIIERVKRGASDHQGAFGRLVMEICAGAVLRALEIAYDRALIKSQIPIDQLLVKMRVKSPMAMARAASHWQHSLNWLQVVLGIEGAKATAPGIARIAKTDDILTDGGRAIGVDPKYILTTDERAAVDKKLAEQQQVASALQALGGKPAGAA